MDPSPALLPNTDLDSASGSDLDMAAAMGFSTFGAQPTARKRKYNPATDAVTSFSPLSSTSSKEPPRPSQSGANMEALGSRNSKEQESTSSNAFMTSSASDSVAERWQGQRKRHLNVPVGARSGQAGGNADINSASGGNRIALGTRNLPRAPTALEKELEQKAMASIMKKAGFDGKSPLDLTEEDTLATEAESDHDGNEAEDDDPRYVEDTPPTTLEPQDSAHLQHPPVTEAERTATGLLHQQHQQQQHPLPTPTHPQPQPTTSPSPIHNPNPNPPPSEDPTLQTPPRPNQASNDPHHPTSHDWNALRKGVRNARGDICYYDASFVEDPWATLMAARGMRD